MSAHAHSSASLAAERGSGRMGRRAEAVLQALRAADSPQTDREIAARLGFTDLNAVRPRITEMIALGLVVEAAGVVCPVTHKTVRTTRALSPSEIVAARAAEDRPIHQPELQLREPNLSRRSSQSGGGPQFALS